MIQFPLSRACWAALGVSLVLVSSSACARAHAGGNDSDDLVGAPSGLVEHTGAISSAVRAIVKESGLDENALSEDPGAMERLYSLAAAMDAHSSRDFVPDLNSPSGSSGDADVLEAGAARLFGCWKTAYGRGVGRPIHTCREGQERGGLLCYPKCRDTYYGVGPVCWQRCKDGYQDDGAFCARHLKIISADNSQCPWYDKCGLFGSNRGCSTCPEGYKNDGCTCRRPPHIYAKSTYGRGVGEPLGCASDEDYDAGLCYTPCERGFRGVGPVCWGLCPALAPDAAGALCCTTSARCDARIHAMGVAVLNLAREAAKLIVDRSEEQIVKAIVAAVEAALQFALPKCSVLQQPLE